MPDTPETTRGPYSFVIGDYLPGTKYVLRRQLGQGGMGAVYEVVKHPHLVGVAKIMLPGHAKNPEMVARFNREIAILAQLNHPHIVRVRDYETLADGTPFYVMERVGGTSLRAFLQGMPTPSPNMIYEIMRGVLEGLYCIHEMGIVHRDIKPENIVLDAPQYGQPGVKLIDFGIADDATSVHVPGLVIGTPSYSAREQILGEKATPQTDIYAAAVVLYEMIAQVRPFDYARGKGEDVFRAEIIDPNKPAPPLRFYASWVPEDAERVIMAALSKDPKERPETAYKFLTDIYNVKSAVFTPRVITEMNTTEPEFTTAIESAARAMEENVEHTARCALAPPVEGSAPELAPDDLAREPEAPAHLPGMHVTRSVPEEASRVRAPKNGTAPFAAERLLPSPREAEPSPEPETAAPVEVSASGPVSRTVTSPPRRRRTGYVALLVSLVAVLSVIAGWRVRSQAPSSSSTIAASPVSSNNSAREAPRPPPSIVDEKAARVAEPSSSARIEPFSSARADASLIPSTVVVPREPVRVALAVPASSAPKAATHPPSSAPSSAPVRSRASVAPKASSGREDSLDDLLALPGLARRPKSGL